MNNDIQETLDRIKAEDEANDRITDRVHVEMMRKRMHDYLDLDMLPAGTRHKLETAETMFYRAEDTYNRTIKKCYLSLNTNRK